MTKPYEEQDIVEKLRNRAEIRRKIGRKPDGKPDRIADTCEQAANEILQLRAIVSNREEPDWQTRHKLKDLLDAYADESKCVQYNGWYRRRDPEDIRKDIDAEIQRLTDSLSKPKE